MYGKARLTKECINPLEFQPTSRQIDNHIDVNFDDIATIHALNRNSAAHSDTCKPMRFGNRNRPMPCISYELDETIMRGAQQISPPSPRHASC